MNNEKLTQLKAEAYDLLAQMEYIQKKLQEVNTQIAEIIHAAPQGEAEE